MQQESKTVIATRVPPGDRWSVVGVEEVQESLMDALEAYYVETEYTGDYYLSPREGKLYRVDMEDTPPPPVKKYSIYENDF